MNYEQAIMISQFKGLMQYGPGIGTDPQYATEEKNMETRAGVLQPVAACTQLAPTTPQPIETLMCLHRRYLGEDVLIAASDGKLYYLDEDWVEIESDGFESSKWSWASYEINPEGSTESVDVLLISNAIDGMYIIKPPYTATEPNPDWAVEIVDTKGKKFGVIERYAERIWGGAIDGNPDMLMYSAPYDPTDWEAQVENPEDGAGDVTQPSWDGDSFTALRAFGSQLIAFKRTRVWRILGTDPGEYTFKEQYGGGAPYEKTIAVDNERIFMLTDRGVVVYDGLSVSPFQQQYLEKIWARLNKNYLSNACAVLWQGKYYLAVPLDTSHVNNAVIIYNTVENTWLLRDDVSVESFLGTEKELYFTSATTPGKVWKFKEDSWTNTPAQVTCRWVSPWMDLGAKNVVKGGFEIYILCEVKENPVTLKVSIQTEKKTKTKIYSVKAQTKEAKHKRLHFGGSGRRFRLMIESDNAAAWRLISGVTIISEIDPD